MSGHHGRSGITCFGEALIDFLARPAGDADTPRQFVEFAGGAPANVAVGVARLGGDACFVGMLGADMFGDFLLSEFQRYGVDTSQIHRTDAARTALAFVSLGEGGERSFEFYRPPSADLMFRVAHYSERRLGEAAVFHVCSNSMTEPASADATLHGMRIARAAGGVVSMDLNLRPALWPAGAKPLATLWPALALAHLVKLSREELAFLADGGDEAPAIQRLFAGTTQAIVVTDGAAPIRWWTRSQHGLAPTAKVTAIDTTGAGDAFVAGLLQGLVERGIGVESLANAFAHDPTRRAVLGYAAAAGALATTRYGAFAAMPSADQVRVLTESA